MPRSFAQLHRRSFEPAVRQRGERYFRQRRVDLLDLTEHRAVGTVRGTSPYPVSVRSYRDAAKVRFACECPFSMGELPCKHLWALLLAVDEVEAGISAVEQREQRVGGADAVAEAPDDADLDEDADEHEFDGEFDDSDDDEPDAADAARKPAAGQPKPPAPAWQQRFARLLPASADASHQPVVPILDYQVFVGGGVGDSAMAVQVRARFPLKNGELGVPRMADLPRDVIDALPSVDRALVVWMERQQVPQWSSLAVLSRRQTVALRQPLFVGGPELGEVLPLLARTGRVLCQLDAMRGPEPIQVDDGAPFRFRIDALVPKVGADRCHVVGLFCRGEARVLAQNCGRLLADDVRIVQGRLVRLACGEHVELANEFARGPIDVPVAELPAVLGVFARLPGAAALLGDLVTQLPAGKPVAVLLVTFPKDAAAPLPVRLQFDYGGELLAPADERPLLETAAGLQRRDNQAEQELRATVARHVDGWRLDGTALLPRERLPAVTQALLQAGVRVLAAGRKVRSFLTGSSAIATGIDWFELGGAVAFTDHTAALPELLKRPITPDGFVELGDGSLGLLPQTWLRRLEALRALGGEADGDVVRVPSSRALLLDALLSAQDHDDVVVDAAFARMRQRLASFTKVEPVQEASSFAGALRPYQREGLGWLQFLREFGLGGCLADDMGLGKTVQVLAHLCAPRADAAVIKKPRKANGAVEEPRPTLLVAPRSVLGNWLAEAKRFAPELRVLDFSTADRWRDGAEQRLRAHDLVLTTYAMLRVDAPQFVERELAFHYAILDEAQAVKNPDSQASKAVRLLRARHRLVLTGTPVENHLGDLWSLFEFLNPGMLGRLPAFRALFGKGASGEAMAQHRELVQRALRPVLLRRTKQQVLKDLPDKVEQTLWCELGPAQKKRYDTLRTHYQKKLLGEPGAFDDSQRFVVLEALLRLRQAACHEALLPGGDAAAESAKFDELLPRLEELAAEGHKALVFSQFTSVLDLLEPKLRERGIEFERLDGKTTKRAERVVRFQEDAKCAVFLISLKAGGFGLNLTAASYVFVLDPWWNPAAEMQAIDRAHRIGQKRVVNAYRLVCRGTVEERVLELQAEKKALCEAILGNERSLLQDLSRADLELLLG